MNKIPIQDVQDHEGNVDANKLFHALAAGQVTILGMDMKALLELRKQYQLRGGPLPITAESVAMLFGDEGIA